ncbi:restriction endonuclease subunit S, partial [Escherichia coli]
MVDLMVNEQRSGTAGKDVPAGYKLTEVGVIPEDWVVISIDDCTTKVGSGKTPTGGASVYIDSGRPFVRSQNVDWGRL